MLPSTDSRFRICRYAGFEEKHRDSSAPASITESTATAGEEDTLDHGAAEAGDFGVCERAEHVGVRETRMTKRSKDEEKRLG